MPTETTGQQCPQRWVEFEPGYYRPDAALREQSYKRFGDQDGLRKSLDTMKRSIRWSSDLLAREKEPANAKR